MIESSDFRTKRMPLNHGAGHMPVLGFGTLIPDAAATISATGDALEAGFRHFDCAERYRNEREVGEALQAGLAARGIAREDIFVTTKLWNSNHRPERTSWKDASTGAVGLGVAAWHGLTYHSQDCGPRAGESQHLRPSGRRA
jgi:diketogulonate reductase-like aldo/keto reductase